MSAPEIPLASLPVEVLQWLAVTQAREQDSIFVQDPNTGGRVQEVLGENGEFDVGFSGDADIEWNVGTEKVCTITLPFEYVGTYVVDVAVRTNSSGDEEPEYTTSQCNISGDFTIEIFPTELNAFGTLVVDEYP